MGEKAKLSEKSVYAFYFFEAFLSLFFSVFLIEVGDMAKQYIEKGLLVPDHVITRLMMLELENRRDQHWLLDGELNLWVNWISVNNWSSFEFHYCSSFEDAFCFHD